MTAAATTTTVHAPRYLWVILPFVLIALAFFFWGVAEKTIDAVRLLVGPHERTTASVTHDGGYRIDSTYAFELDGRAYRGRGGTKDKRGDRIEVVYAAANPAVNRPAGELWFDAGIGIVIFAAMIIGFARVAIVSRRRKAAMVMRDVDRGS